jgi:hypothetical protein
MRKLTVLTDMRVGSTLLCNILSDLLSLRYDHIKFMEFPRDIARFRAELEKHRFLKQHHLLQSELLNLEIDTHCVISVVRSPRAVLLSSFCYHECNKEKNQENLLHFFRSRCADIGKFVDRMEYGCSTRAMPQNKYIWTTYEWLVVDPKREIRSLANFLSLDVSIERITRATGRIGRGPAGDNQGYRRGLMTEWSAIFGEQLMAETAQLEERYWTLVGKENDLVSRA